MFLLIVLLFLALTVASDFAFLHSVKRFVAPSKMLPFRLLCLLTEGFLVFFVGLIMTETQTVLPHPTAMLIALTLLFPKLLFLILWLLFVRPFHCMKGSLYNFLSACLLSLLLGGAILYGGLRERFLVEVNEVTVQSARLPRSFDGYRIAQISDFHAGSLTEADTAFVRSMVDSIIAREPDMVCFTGDFVNIHSSELRPFMRELSRLCTRRHRVYAIMGNHDYADYDHFMTDSMRSADTDTLRQMVAEMGWTLLDNRGDRIRHRSFRRLGDFFDPVETLRILGVGNIGEPPFNTYGDLEQAIGSLPVNRGVPEERFTILLSHNPTHWRNEVLQYPDIDLTLSGHTHGMQMKIFGWSPASWRYQEWGGLYHEGSQSLYVNTGIGTVGFPIRIGLKPEVTLLTLKRVEE